MGEYSLDKEYIVKQLAALADKFGLDIGADVLEEVVGFSKFKVYSKGEILACVGNDASCAAIVMSGVVRSYYVDGDGNDITQYFSAEGSFCMDEGMMGYSENVAVWEAIEESTVMLFEVKRMKALIFSNEQLKTLWIELLEGAMRYKIYRENGFLVQNATERFLTFRKRYPELSERVSQQYIATYLGIKPESLSRIKAALKGSK